MIEVSESFMMILNLKEDLSYQCWEPAIANGLCIAHVANGDWSTIIGARECIKMWEGRPSLADEPYISDEAWRVLAEVDKIRKHGTSNSIIPRNVDTAMAGAMFMTAMFFDSASLEERVLLAFWMSPYSIGQTLGIEPINVRYHLRHLADTGYIELDQAYELPQSLIVTRRIQFPRKVSRSWRRAKFFQKFSSGYSTPRIQNLPKPNEQVIEPVLDGPGIIEPDQQGQVLALTQRGRVELRSWDLRLAEERQLERRRKHELGLTIVLVALTALLLISAISDAPNAWHVLEDWYRTVISQGHNSRAQR